MKLFRRLTLHDIALAELMETQKKLLQAQTALEFAQSVVSQHSSTVARLKEQLADNTLVEIRDRVGSDRPDPTWALDGAFLVPAGP